MSSQKTRKTKQKSLFSWVKPQDTKVRVEDENVEESCAAEVPEGVLRAARIMLLLSLLKQLVPSYLYYEIDQISQEIYHFLLSPMETGTRPFSRGGLITIRGCTTLEVLMLYFAIPISKL